MDIQENILGVAFYLFMDTGYKHKSLHENLTCVERIVYNDAVPYQLKEIRILLLGINKDSNLAGIFTGIQARKQTRF